MKKLKHKKEIIIINFLILILAILAFLIPTKNDEKEILHNNTNLNYIINSNAITMMYETEAGSGEYQTTTNTSWPGDGYVFNERLSGCENGGTLSWNSETNKVIMESNTSDRCYIYFDIYRTTLAEYILNNVYSSDGVNGLYYHDGVGTYTNVDQEAGDNSDRYSGANPNNYVCFGSDATPCPNEYLYRIIGVFDEDGNGEHKVKIIKENINENATASAWDTNNLNNWTLSSLNIELNTTYLNSLNTEWSNKIEIVTWFLGGMDNYNNYNAKEFFNGERNNAGYESNPTRYEAKIGLMYVSDVAYSSDPNDWLINLYDYFVDSNYSGNNWLARYNEWTITPYTKSSSYVFSLSAPSSYGFFYYKNASSATHFYRPAFYLKANISYVDGDGTKSSPYRIN